MPSPDKIKRELYEDHDVPPYFVDGPNPASVTSVGAISLLNRYCQQLLRDRYTQLAPEWYLDVDTSTGMPANIVSIELPICCPIRHRIKGLPMGSKQAAKRSAALEVIKELHRLGELTDKLLPRSDKETEENFDFFFSHWEKEPQAGDVTDGEDVAARVKAGTKKFLREYDIVVS